jgi:serine/threonine protein kinase
MYKSHEYFNENFQKGKLIGKGSFSRVYEVFEIATKTKYALKEIEIDDDYIQRSTQSSNKDSWFFLSEKVSDICQIFMEPHPNLANIKFFFKRTQTSQLFFCIVIEFLPLTLEQEIREVYNTGSPCIQMPHFLRISYCILDGLIFLQSRHKIAHRDLKPANIMVNPEGKYKIIDLGK